VRHKCDQPRGTPKLELTDEIVLAQMIRMVNETCESLATAQAIIAEQTATITMLTEALRQDTGMRQIIEKLRAMHPSARTIQ
jgi:ACT domain-containing protein